MSSGVAVIEHIDLRPSLHLPRAPCDNFVCDFPYGFFGTSYVAAGYGVCVYIIHDYRAIF